MSGQLCTVDRKNLKIEDLLLRIRERDNAVNVSSRIEGFKSDRSLTIPDMNLDDSDSGRCATGAVRPPCPQQHIIQSAHVTSRQNNKDLATQDEVSRHIPAPHEASRFMQNLDRNPERGDA